MENLVQCLSCLMFVEYSRSRLNFLGVSMEDAKRDGFTCKKCVKVRELEEELQKSKCGLEWTTVRRAAGRRREDPVREPVLVSENSFGVLEVESTGECMEEVSQVTEGESVKGRWTKQKVKGKCVLIGDSIVRYVDREFSKVDKFKRTRVCLPGARVEDINARINRLVDDEEVVVVEVGTNNLRSDSQVVLRSRFRELLHRLRSTRAKVAVCGILPRFDGRVAGSTIDGLNQWLELECQEQGVRFVDVSCFRGRRDLFARDGLHLSGAGATVLGKLVNVCVGGLSSN